MQIFIERTKEEIDKAFSGKASKLLEELNLLPEEVLVVRNGTLVTEDEDLESEDKIKILSVISGG